MTEERLFDSSRVTNATNVVESQAALETTQAVAYLVAALIAADGFADPDELAIAHAACAKYGVSATQLDAALVQGGQDPSKMFRDALRAIDRPAQREELASILFEVASVDERLDRREAELLSAMRDAWGVSVAFLNRPIEWDEDQQLVIEAPASDRILVSAGPGMGKTSVACSRVAYLVDKEDVTDSNIWMVSFTRAAVAEIKGRISDFAEDPSNVFSVKISTIDSQAWKIRYGFSPEQADKLFGGFDTGIARAVDLMDERADDFRDAFGNLEHFIIDEAQDITGPRARFLLKMIELLPESCGLTVFHDPAQAIYDYADEEASPFRFTDALRDRLGSRLQDFALKRIYRTEEPALLRLYEDLRLDILGNADVSPSDFQSKADMVKKAAASVGGRQFDQASLRGYDDALVLFRRRIEVAQASSFMAKDRLSHRLRMSGLPRLIQPWIALTLGTVATRTLSRGAFLDALAGAGAMVPADVLNSEGPGNAPDARWDLLRRYATAPGLEVDLHRLRARLASSPPDEFVMAEFGHKGPILGTIHASKGREADYVFLQINDNWCSGEGEQGDLSEESRVLFVGATRAKRSLAVQGGFALKFSRTTESGRCYRASPKFKTGFQVQIGLAGDFDTFSVARLEQPIDHSSMPQMPFKCSAMLETGTWIYRLVDEEGRRLGSLTKAVNNDFFEIGKANPGRGRKPGDRIDNIHVLGFGTAVAAPGDERLAGARGTAAVSGFWLVPQITGLPMVFLKW